MRISDTDPDLNIETDIQTISIKPTPIFNLVEQLTKIEIRDDTKKSGWRQLSERSIAETIFEKDKTKPKSDDGTVIGTKKTDNKKPGAISSSHFTRILNGFGTFDFSTVNLIARFAAKTLGWDENVASQAILAEYAVWKASTQGNENPSLPSSVEIRSPIARTKLFKQMATAILFTKYRVIVIEANNSGRIGRSAFGVSLASYVSSDVPDRYRRTLLNVSLAELRGNAGHVTADEVAYRVSASLILPRRTGRQEITVYQNIADALKYIKRPLLFIRDGREVRDKVLTEFLRKLFAALSMNGDAKVLITAQGTLTDDYGPLNETVPTRSFHHPFMEPEEMARHIRWKANISREKESQIAEIISELPEEIHKPSVASALAGGYLLDRFLPGLTPWEWLSKQAIPKKSDKESSKPNDVVAVIKSILDTKPMNRASDVFSAASANQGKRKGLGEYEQILLTRLAIFNGRFSEDAARACMVASNPTINESPEFGRALSRVCMSGAVINESIAKPVYYSLLSEVRKFVQDSSLYDEQGREAKQNYFAYLGREIQAAIDHFSSASFAVDTASPEAFSRLEPELFHIDFFLTDMWVMLQKSQHDRKTALPLPEISPDNLPETNDVFHLLGWDVKEFRKKIWLLLLCANLALFWEVRNLAGTAVRHLEKSEELASILIKEIKGSEVQGYEGVQRILCELCAIRAQLLLSRLHIEVRLRRSELPSDEIDALSNRAKEDLQFTTDSNCDYKYGQALALLIDGIKENRRCSVKGISATDGAIKLAAELAQTAEDKPLPADTSDTSLLIAKARLPIARSLTFMAVREKNRALLRGGEVDDALELGESLIQATTMVAEPRLIADALLCQLHAYWCKFALSSERPLTEEQLQQTRDLLFQVAPYINELPSDKATFRGHFTTSFGLYNLEKGLATHELLPNRAIDWWPSDLRLEFGEQLFSTGMSQVNDVHWICVFNAFIANAYYRFDKAGGKLKEKEPVSTVAPDDKTIKEPVIISPLSMAAAYFIRSLYAMGQESKEQFGPSRILLTIYEKLYSALGEDTVRTVSAIYAKTANLEDMTDRIMGFLKERFPESACENQPSPAT